MILTTDPRIGDRVPLATLGRRYGLSSQLVHYRYKAGDRGENLIRPKAQPRPEPVRRKPADQKLAALVARHSARFERKGFEGFLGTPQGRLTTNLFKDYGRVS